MSAIGKLEESQARSPTRSRLRGWLTSAGDWLEERTGFTAPVRNFFAYPVPGYVHKNLLYSLGGLSFISIMLQFATGILLSFYYAPSIADAYNSVDYINYQLPLGWLARGLHHYNASAIVILTSLHLTRVFFSSAYKKPREVTWLSGVVMLLLTLAVAFTGALLPYDQRGYWATRVGMEIARSAPLAGSWTARLLQGGESLGQVTLGRFYVIHTMLLPLTMLALIGLHIQQLRRHGVAPALTGRAQALARKFVPFFPHWITLDATLGAALLAGLAALSWFARAPLEFPADPGSVDYVPRPEWYFLFLYQSLKYFPGALEPIAAFVLPSVVVGSLLLLPFLDRGEERRPWRKPLTSMIALVFIAAMLVLTLLASIEPASQP